MSYGGGTIVGMSSSANGDEAVRWGFLGPSTAVGDIPGGAFASDAFACSDDGQVVFGAGINASGNAESFRWTAAGGIVPLGFLPTGGSGSRAFGSTSDGTQACGENIFPPVTQAFRWTQSGGMQGLGFLPGSGNSYSTGRAMSFDGHTIVGWAQGADLADHPFRWTEANGMQQIGSFPGAARGISYGGVWIVGNDASTSQAFRWSQGSGVQELGVLAGHTSSIAVAVSNDGSRVLGVCDVGGSGQVAAVWHQGIHGSACGPFWSTVADLLASSGVSTAGWTLSTAVAMSWDGRVIAGHGTNPSGQTQAWVAVLNPFPNPPVCTTADFNCDGDIGTDADIEGFFACLAGQCPPWPCCTSADFNGDGDIGTDADIESFFRVLSSSC
jgi:uncharacterized membrane protein